MSGVTLWEKQEKLLKKDIQELHKVADAVVIDTSDMSIEAAVAAATDEIRARLKHVSG